MEAPEKPADPIEASDWWSQPCGPREVLALALPLVISTGSWTLMHFTDRMFLLWHSTEEVAAAFPAGMMFFTLLCFPLGVATYLNTFVAQYMGAGHNERIGRVVWQGIWLGIACIPLFLLLAPTGPWIFGAAGHSERVVELESVYFGILLAGGGVHILGASLSAFFSGRGDTVTVMWVTLACTALNILLDYPMIFGLWGFPEMGIAGAAWATVIADIAKAAIFAALLFTPEHRETYALDESWALDLPLVERLLYFGGPNGLNMVIEVGAFTAFILLLGSLGEQALAATNLAFNVNAAAFVPMIGLGIALGVLVGRELGRDRVDLAWRASWNSLAIALIYTGVFAAAYLFVPDLFLLGHRWGVEAAGNPEELAKFAELREVTITLLQFVAIYCLVDALNIIMASALKGAGDTLFVMFAMLVIGAIGCLVGWYGLTYLGFDLIACWWVITGWIVVTGLTFLVRFLGGAWQEMRVIEPELVAHGE